jgi:hypothetical protein
VEVDVRLAPQARPGDLLPPLDVRDRDGRSVDISSYAPSVVLLCAAGDPLSDAVIDELRRSGDEVASRVVLVWSSAAAWRHDLPVNAELCADVGIAAADVCGLGGTPAAVVIDAGGRVCEVVTGLDDACAAMRRPEMAGVGG